VQVPGVDVTASGVPGLADASRSIEPTSPIVLLDTTTHKRLPFWAELDNPSNHLVAHDQR